jgi:hypothetical protein
VIGIGAGRPFPVLKQWGNVAVLYLVLAGCGHSTYPPYSWPRDGSCSVVSTVFLAASSSPVLGARLLLSTAEADDPLLLPPQLRPRQMVVLGGALIRLQRIYNFLCSMLVYTPFAYCFVTLRGTFMHFPELTY